MWCIPPEQNAEFVYAMENVLEVYHRPYAPKRPMICMDETSKQLVKETRVPRVTVPGRAARFDYECCIRVRCVAIIPRSGGEPWVLRVSAEPLSPLASRFH